ncbi:glycosyltransferase [Thomasclavelia sp.]
MKKIRVLHCLGQLNTGGSETLVINLLRNIDRNKFQFDFLVFNDNPGFYDEEVKSLGSRIYYLPSISSVGIQNYFNKMVEFFKVIDIDVIHSHMDWQGGFISYAASKAGIKKIVVHSHANQKMFDNNMIHKIMIKINKYLIKKYATNLCACSKEAGKSLFGNENYTIITNGIDMKKYIQPDSSIIEGLYEEFNLNKDDILLGNVGSFSENKNQIFLIRILKELVKENKHYKLILVGDGPLKDRLEKEVKNNNLSDHVIFTGVRKEIPEIMHLFSVFLFPSKMEGLGIVAIEAQTSGIPCIVSDKLPKQLNMNIGLINFKELDVFLWIEEIKKIRKNNIKKNILSEDNEYNIKFTINQLSKIYL